ncbi:MAG TPA: methyltransferase domain-containing protein [Gemmatimonadales bacterium]|nr:methyltransferase domain-containing protein [Gemmatimonadales bacterium]
MTSPALAWSQVARAYQRNILPGFTPAAAALCTALHVGPGDRVLDIACGPGTLSLAALRQGATHVTGVDFATEMVALAQAATIGRGAEFFLGDATALPVPDAAFDVGASSFGAIFAPDPRRAIGELHRALVPGGRAGLLAWLRGDTTNAYYDRVYRHIPRPQTAHDPYAWGEHATARKWFGEWFGYLELSTITVPYEGPTPAAVWEVLRTSTGRVAVSYAALDRSAQERMDREMIDFFDRFRRPEGGVYWPREALMVTGVK